MIEIRGNLWTANADWRGITTNGFVKSNGECVMGRGCAREARDRFPGLAWRLGRDIQTSGNIVRFYPDLELFIFPVKHRWMEPADPALIKESARALGIQARLRPERIFVLPRPGCGNGGLSWSDVQPLLTTLPDNVHIITF